MALSDIVETVHGEWINQQQIGYQCPLPDHNGGGDKAFARETQDGKLVLWCTGGRGHKQVEIAAAFGINLNGSPPSATNGAGAQDDPRPPDPAPFSSPLQRLESFKLKILEAAQNAFSRAAKMPNGVEYLRATERAALLESTLGSIREAREKQPLWFALDSDLTPIEVEEHVEEMAAAAVDQFLDENAEQLPAIREDRDPALREEQLPMITLRWEDHAQAIVANQEYLTHTPIIEGLCYARTASLLVGGKHSGKTTNARTIATSVYRGISVFGRQTTQGPVLYCASEDEALVVRAEMLRMGWSAGDPLHLMSLDHGMMAEPQRLLDAIAFFANERKAVLIVLDMLFDFAGIKDEMSYAGTRESAGKVYDLAMRTNAHVLATHHSPKYLSGGATAETAALGSQGVAARFSPIILSRHWGGDLYTIESTPPRDPRGKALAAYCVTLDASGMAIMGETFSDTMRWRVLAPKVMDFIANVEPGMRHTVTALSEVMEVNRPMMQTILYNLTKEGKLHREKTGRSYKYFIQQEQGDMWNERD